MSIPCIFDQWLSAAIFLGIDTEALTFEKNSQIRKNTLLKYTSCKNWPHWVWEHLKTDCTAFTQPEAWQLLQTFETDKPLILLFQDYLEERAFIVNNTKDLTAILAECYDFEFCLTNLETDYFICFNHHDNIFACGTAQDWLTNLSQNPPIFPEVSFDELRFPLIEYPPETYIHRDPSVLTGQEPKLEIIEFNGWGEPSPTHFGTGSVVLCVQGDQAKVMQLELLPRDQSGPRFKPALNQAELQNDIQAALQKSFPSGLRMYREWVFDCPSEIAESALFGP